MVAKKSGARSKKPEQQSAMEYLMTYGWAILVVAVVIAALFGLGAFNINNTPKSVPGSCYVYRPDGPESTWYAHLAGQCGSAPPQFVTTFYASPTQGSYISTQAEPKAASMTVTMWVWQNSYSSESANIAGMILDPDVFKVSSSGPGQGVNVSIHTSGSTWTNEYTGNSVIPLKQWTFYAFTFSAGTLTQYIDAKMVQESNTGTGGLYSSNGTIIIGTTFIDRDDFNGSIANVQIYNTSLTSNEISYVYFEGLGGAPVDVIDLAGWWPLNGNTNDYSGNNHNGLPENIRFNGTWANAYSQPTPTTITTSIYTSITTTTSTTSTSTTSTTSTTTIAASEYIYCISGVISPANNSVYYAPILGNNSIGAWASSTPYPAGVWGHSCVAYNGHIYCVGGFAGSNLSNSYYAPLASNGVWAWSSTNSIMIEQDPCMAYGGYMYCVDGYEGTIYSQLSSNGTGAWQYGPSYPRYPTLFSCVAYSGYIYCVGGQSGYTAINGTTLPYAYYESASGSNIGAWQATANYPINVSSESCSAYNGYIYCTGGITGNSNSIVNYMDTQASYYAMISSNGISSWQQTTPYPVAYSGGGQCISYNGYIYCGGGFIGGAMYYAQLSSNGIGTWQSTTTYPLDIGDSQACVVSSP